MLFAEKFDSRIDACEGDLRLNLAQPGRPALLPAEKFDRCLHVFEHGLQLSLPRPARRHALKYGKRFPEFQNRLISRGRQSAAVIHEHRHVLHGGFSINVRISSLILFSSAISLPICRNHTTNPRPPAGAIAIQGGDRLLRIRAGTVAQVRPRRPRRCELLLRFTGADARTFPSARGAQNSGPVLLD